MKKFTDQQLNDALKEAPPPIQKELTDGEGTAITIFNIGKKLQLHIDKIGLIATLNRDMLLGLIKPEEFLTELLAMKIPDAQAREIMAEINTKIFVPLREEMRSAGRVPAPAQPMPVAPQARPASAPVPVRPQTINLIAKSPDQVSLPPAPAISLSTAVRNAIQHPPLVPPPAPKPTVVQVRPEQTKPPILPPSSYTTDPYREPIDEK